MYSVEELTYDNDFCTTFIVEKRSDTVWEKGVQTATVTQVNVTGIVLPASAKDLELVEEGDRKHGLKTFLTHDCPLNVTDTEDTSDVVIWDGNRYKLIHAFNYAQWGYYKAIGELMGAVPEPEPEPEPEEPTGGEDDE